jgi:hypothetical protein
MKSDSVLFVHSYTPDEKKFVEISQSHCPAFSAVVVHLEGTNDTGITRTSANNGYVELTLSRAGQSIGMGKFSLADFAQINDDTGGLVRADSTVSAAFRFRYEIPLNDPDTDDANGIALGPNDKLIIVFDDMNATAAFTAATLQVKVVPSETAAMDYANYFAYGQFDLGGKVKTTIPVENIQLLMLSLSSTAPDNIGIMKRGQPFIDPKSDWTELVDNTRNRYRIETAPSDHVLINFAKPDQHGAVGYWKAIGRQYVKNGVVMSTAARAQAVRSARSSLVSAARKVG